MKKTILLADDHILVREGIAKLIDTERFTLVAEANDGQEAYTQFKKHRPHIVLLDVRMPELNGIEAARKILRDAPETIVVFISATADSNDLTEALELPIKGFLLKSCTSAALNHTLAMVAEGGSAFPADVLRANIANQPLARHISSNLTPREEQILQRLAKGEANKVIARNLSVSEGTVKVHIKAILKKLDLTNRTQAAIYAHEHDIGLNASA